MSKTDLWMPLYVGDYLADTGHLSTVEHGAYLLLLMHYWRKRGLPDDDRQLAAIAKLPLRIWSDVKPNLQAFFHDGWRHKRLEAELEKRAIVSAKRAAAGAKGGLKSQMNNMLNEANARICSSMTQSHKDITTTVRVERREFGGEQAGTSRLSLSPEASALMRKIGA